MKLIQITDAGTLSTIRSTYFTFETPSNTPILMHSINVDGERVGFVATEDYGKIGGPHIFISEQFRNKEYMVKVNWLFQNVYCPLMKALGKEFLLTDCDQEDRGTVNFLTKAGFDIKNITIAELKL